MEILLEWAGLFSREIAYTSLSVHFSSYRKCDPATLLWRTCEWQRLVLSQRS